MGPNFPRHIPQGALMARKRCRHFLRHAPFAYRGLLMAKQKACARSFSAGRDRAQAEVAQAAVDIHVPVALASRAENRELAGGGFRVPGDQPPAAAGAAPGAAFFY